MDKATIWNIALTHVGEKSNVVNTDPPDQTKQAQYCSIFYEHCVKLCLTDGQWGFATKVAKLAEVTNNDTRWAYCYGLPSDFLSVNMVFETGDTSTYLGSNQIEYSVLDGKLYTNQPNASIEYVWDVTDVSKFTSKFVDALGYLLASYLAGVLISGDTGVAAALKLGQAYSMAKAQALNHAGRQRLLRPNYQPEGIRSRG